MITDKTYDLIAVRRIGSSLKFVDLSTIGPKTLYKVFAEYKLSKAKQISKPSSPSSTLLYAENFDPFAADNRHLAQRLKALENLVKNSSSSIILRTSSPLVLLATPLLKNPRIKVLYLLSEEHLHLPTLKESISAAKTLVKVGCQVSLITSASFQSKLRQGGSFLDIRSALKSSGLPFVFEDFSKISPTKAAFHLGQWLQNSTAEEDTRDAA